MWALLSYDTDTHIQMGGCIYSIYEISFVTHIQLSLSLSYQFSFFHFLDGRHFILSQRVHATKKNIYMKNMICTLGKSTQTVLSAICN